MCPTGAHDFTPALTTGGSYCTKCGATMVFTNTGAIITPATIAKVAT